MKSSKNKIVVLSCMHGRQQTVKYCLDKMPFVDKIMIYSTDEDGEFLKGEDVFAYAQAPNQPLSNKWQAAVQSLEGLDFDAMILLGSDDYIDEAFLQYAKDNIEGFDMIGFTDAYYEQDGQFYYWSGYDNHRQGEPVGAGKIYSREFLERIGFYLYPFAAEKGLDRMAHNVCVRSKAKMHITSLKENGLFMCDVKDGEGMNSLEKLQSVFNFEKVAPNQK